MISLIEQCTSAGRGWLQLRAGQANIRREEGRGGGEGVWGPKVCGPTMAQSDFPNCTFRFPPRRTLWSWGGGSSRRPFQCNAGAGGSIKAGWVPCGAAGAPCSGRGWGGGGGGFAGPAPALVALAQGHPAHIWPRASWGVWDRAFTFFLQRLRRVPKRRMVGDRGLRASPWVMHQFPNRK